ncbi:Zn(2+)-responsive transcriptional regulator [Paucibacter sp. O1-1]|nr:Zn(2+)-responsive transcriptional regulator [Paucibacter sp. O1-1]MDA3830867.1 Zn(2+)-responsive transcriptional regulator [Paucibacter sp. O1-1]
MYVTSELSALYDIKVDTLRFYEKHGLLSPSSRSGSAIDYIIKTTLKGWKFILRAKAVGFSLNDIADLLSFEVDKSNRACAEVKGLVDTKLEQVEAKLAELQHFAKSLSNTCCGSDSAEHCSILEALESSDQHIIAKKEHHHFSHSGHKD